MGLPPAQARPHRDHAIPGGRSRALVSYPNPLPRRFPVCRLSTNNCGRRHVSPLIPASSCHEIDSMSLCRLLHPPILDVCSNGYTAPAAAGRLLKVFGRRAECSRAPPGHPGQQRACETAAPTLARRFGHLTARPQCTAAIPGSRSHLCPGVPDLSKRTRLAQLAPNAPCLCRVSTTCYENSACASRVYMSLRYLCFPCLRSLWWTGFTRRDFCCGLSPCGSRSGSCYKGLRARSDAGGIAREPSRGPRREKRENPRGGRKKPPGDETPDLA